MDHFIIIYLIINILFLVYNIESLPCRDYTESKYYCDIYYKCVDDKLKINSCNNNTVRYKDMCITQDEYKNITGNYCAKCVKTRVFPGIHYSPIECDKLSNFMCCFQETYFTIYCTKASTIIHFGNKYNDDDYYWIKDYYNTDCKTILENRRL
ncbi:unknown similar to AMEVITR04 [Choristoneura biennis entomopoxvirus]|uniref:Uncharacterized protein n=1 Tax=Choristoneura biennis entomopoxvirus TaxID=10288 RepID=A0A916NY98_CBEPV|nr:unknown similar to AMEVITR04 [Choristoneura biennis entomopoxvirus]CCU55873.1 unknown similar to AMEVITR04 [Choristoneura biennis entomopoxvirus]